RSPASADPAGIAGPLRAAVRLGRALGRRRQSGGLQLPRQPVYLLPNTAVMVLDLDANGTVVSGHGFLVVLCQVGGLETARSDSLGDRHGHLPRLRAGLAGFGGTARLPLPSTWTM